MKILKPYIVTLLVGLVLILTLTVTTRDEGSVLTNAQKQSYNEDWTVKIGRSEKTYKELPDKVYLNGADTIDLKKQLPEQINSGEAIVFFMGHSIINAYVEDELIYTFDIPQAYEKRSKTPGNTWNFINMEEEYAGKTLTLELKPIYENKTANIPQLVYGDKAKIVSEIVIKKSVTVVISMLLIFIGVALMGAFAFFRERLHLENYIIWLSLFAIVVGVWSFVETQILSLLYAQSVEGSRISYILLQLILIPILSFSKELWHREKDRIYDVLCGASIVLLVVTTALQFAGIADYYESVWAVHVLFALGGLWMAGLMIKELLKGNKEDKTALLLCLVGEIAVAVAVITDMRNAYSVEMVDSAKNSCLWILLYVILLLCLSLRDSVKLIRLGEQFETVSEEAMRDAMTKLSNRAAFEKNMTFFKAEKGNAAIMFDLNNLKYFNDEHGHAMGDYYIIVCSEIIQDVFGSYGKVYRMGGDEFCAIVEGMNVEKFDELQAEMNTRIEGLNGRFFENKMSVASGYAAYDPETDADIHATVKRADEKMYNYKAVMKQGR